MKCLRTRGVCDGYYIKPRKNESKRSKQTVRVVKTTGTSSNAETDSLTISVDDTAPSNASKTSSTLFLEPDINSIDFANPSQHAYFEEWQYLTTRPLGGYSASKLWTVFMPQLSRQSPALRLAAMSIGAMSRALALRCTGADPLKTIHYNNAVDLYCRALRAQRAAKLNSIRDILVTSILFIGFEALRGNKKSALAHVMHGFSLLGNILTDETGRLQYLAPHPTELVAEILRLYFQVGVQTQTVLTSHLGQQDPPTKVLTGSIRLEQKGTEGFIQTINTWLRPKMELDTFPSEIQNVQEAEGCWEAVEHSISATGSGLVALVYDLQLPDATDDELVDRFFSALSRHPRILQFVKSSQTRLNKFDEAFQLLYSQASPHINKEHFIRLVQIRIDYLAQKLYSLFSVRYSLKVVLTLTPLCRELNDLCETILKEQYVNPRGPSDRFSMRSALTWHLTFVAMNCRDAMVRENAIRILDVYPRRDCLIDSRALQAVAERNRTLEIVNAATSDPPEVQWQRLCRRVFLFEDAGLKIVFRAMHPSVDESTGKTKWELREETTVSDSWCDEHPEPEKQWKTRPLTSRGLILQWGRTSTVWADGLYSTMAGTSSNGGPGALCLA